MEKAIELKNYKKAAITAGFVMMSIILPQIFHLAGLSGQVFLPMHIPVLIAGFLLGPTWGMIAGIVSPVISTALTGMPAEFPMMPIMVLELGTYGLVSGLLNKYTKLPIVGTLLISMVAGRISYLIAYELIKVFFLPTISTNISVISASRAGIPGIIIQLVIATVFMISLRNKNREKKVDKINE